MSEMVIDYVKTELERLLGGLYMMEICTKDGKTRQEVIGKPVLFLPFPLFILLFFN